ncbi:tape measure protein [Pseudomonas aeruginosa]|nr:tape measure protein [Pseudomonas aeruginosa]
MFSIREIIQTTDAWTNLQNRLRLVTSTQAQLAAVTADVYRIAQLTSSALDSTATVYQRFAQNADRLNISQRQVASLTDTVAKSIAISGASAQSAEAALVQFGQALASGVLRGEEFNSVSEQAPALLKAIADGLNVNIGELRKMANEGQLTADVLVDALSNAAAGVNDQFATGIKTVSMAVQELENAFTRLVGEFTNGRGAGEALAGAISGVANVMDGLSDNAELLGTALDAVMVTAAGRAVAAITGLTTTWPATRRPVAPQPSPPLRKQRPTKAPPWRHSEPLPRSYNGPRPLSPRQRPRWPPAAPARPPVSRTFGTSRPLWLRSARWSRPGFRRRSPILVGSSPRSPG